MGIFLSALRPKPSVITALSTLECASSEQYTTTFGISALLLGTCILTVIAFKWYSAIAIPIAVAIYATYQGFSALARSKLTTISWMLALSIAALILAGPRDPLLSALIFTFLLSLWALRFTYVAAVRSLRAFVLRNARAYNWLRGEVRVEPAKR